jgi:predicted phosphodiesterase
VKLGVVADVHANLPALETALEALAGADVLVCAGDLVGYGAQPNECVARLREAGALCVMGNHDLMAIGAASLEVGDRLVETTMRWTRGALDEPTRRFLSELPGTRTVGDEVVVAHGAPDDPWHYVREPADAADQLARMPGARVLLVGHTHRALAVTEDGTAAVPDHVRLGAARWLLNPGSVGQSRERDALVRVLALDLDARTARFRALPYDVERARDALRRAGLPLEAYHRRPHPWRSRAGRVRDRLLRARS